MRPFAFSDKVPRVPWRYHLLIFLYGVVVLMVLLDNGATLSRHEVFAAEPAREMVAGGVPWSVQTFAGVVRTEKPPTMSWLIAACMKVTGSQSEFVCRFPAALAGIVTAHAIGIITTRFLGPTGGLLAGLMTLTTFWVQMQARLGEADMPLVAAVTVAMACVAPRRGPEDETAGNVASDRDESSLAPSLLFYAATGLGFLLKMVAPLVTIPAAIMWAWWARDRRVWKMLRHPAGLMVLLLFLVVWPVMAYRAHPAILQDWREQTVDRTTGQLEGDRKKPTVVGYIVGLPFYLWWTPILLLPTTPAVVIGILALRNKRRDPTPSPQGEETAPSPHPSSVGTREMQLALGRFVVCWVVPFGVLITLSAWRHKHYVLPVLPALSILGAYGTLVYFRRYEPRKARNLLIAWFVGCAMVILAVQLFILPKHDSYRVHAEIAWQANKIVPPGTQVKLIGIGQAHPAFYLNVIPERIDDPTKTPTDKPIYAITDLRTLAKLRERHTVEQLAAANLRRHDEEVDRLVLVKVN